MDKKTNLILKQSLYIILLLLQTLYANDKLPHVKILSVERIFNNGEHNAFTDLCFFKGNYYLTFRSCPDGHMVFPSSSIIILSSSDGKDWRQVHRFNVANRDTRDPHFLVFKKKLFVYTGTWYCESDHPDEEQRDLNQHLGYCVWSDDGLKWNGPEMLEGTYGQYVWRAATYKNKVYLCARRKHQFAVMPGYEDSHLITEAAMLSSTDGINFTKAAMFQTEDGDETAFLFEKNSELVALTRRGTSNAEICRSMPPYKEWKRKDLGQYLSGPLLVKWLDQYFIGGKEFIKEDSTQTAFYWLDNDSLVKAVELPSGGDNSYPGFVRLSENHVMVSYYSSHEKDEQGNTITAIYLAHLYAEKDNYLKSWIDKIKKNFTQKH